MPDRIITYRWPRSWLPRRAGFFPLSGAVFSTSRYTGKQRIAQIGATPWIARLDFSPMPQGDGERDWKKVKALLLRLAEGHRVRLFDPECAYPRGIAAGIHAGNRQQAGTEPFADAGLFADGTGFRNGSTRAWLARTHRRGEREVLLKELVPSQAAALVVGDEMEIAGYKHSVLATVRSDAQGRTLAPIFPPLRVDVLELSIDARVSFEYPTSPFMLADPNYAGFDVERPSRAPIGLTLLEDLP